MKNLMILGCFFLGSTAFAQTTTQMESIEYPTDPVIAPADLNKTDAEQITFVKQGFEKREMVQYVNPKTTPKRKCFIAVICPSF
jgi:hypothetical protein